jgi:FtsZ-interacting cell division protein ZipA
MTTSENNNNDNSIIIFIIAIITIVCLCSCSTRKVNKSETKIETVSETTKVDTSKTVTKVDSNTKIIDSSTSNEIEYIPIDNTLPFTVNGQTYKNVKIKHSKKKNNITIDKTKKVSQIENKYVSQGTKDKTSKTVEVKVTEKQSFNFWWLLLLLIPAYFWIRKYFV